MHYFFFYFLFSLLLLKIKEIIKENLGTRRVLVGYPVEHFKWPLTVIARNMVFCQSWLWRHNGPLANFLPIFILLNYNFSKSLSSKTFYSPLIMINDFFFFFLLPKVFITSQTQAEILFYFILFLTFD